MTAALRRALHLPWPWVAALVIGLVAAGNVEWLLAHRTELPFDIDEAGHLATAWDYAHALTTHGLPGVLHQFRTPSTVGPVVPIIGTVFVLLAPQTPSVGLLVEIVFLVLLLASTFKVASAVCGPAWAVLAVLVTAGVPAVIDLSRTDQYAVPAGAFLMAGLWAMLASDGGRRLPQMLVAGASIGVMLLTRTMTLVFLPGLAVAGLAVIARGRWPARRAWFGALAAVGVAFLIAASWYVRSGAVALRYLTSVGYDREAASPLTLAHWTARALQATRELSLPMAAVLMPLVLVGTWRLAMAGRGRAGSGLESVVALLALLALGYVGLSTTTNAGIGFLVPLYPVLVVYAVAAAAGFRWHGIRRLAGSALVVAALVGLVSKSDLALPISTRLIMRVPLVGRVPVWQRDDALLRAMAALTLEGLASAPKWRTASHDAALAIEKAAPGAPVWTTSTADFLNYNTIRMEARYQDGVGLSVLPLDLDGSSALALGHRVAALGYPAVLVTGEGEGIGSSRSASAAADMLRSLGYSMVAVVPSPDGGAVTVWRSDGTPGRPFPG